MNAIRPSASAAGVATSVMTRAVAAASLRTRGLLRIVGAAARWQADPPSVLTSTHPPKGWAPGFWLSPTFRDDSPPLRQRIRSRPGLSNESLPVCRIQGPGRLERGLRDERHGDCERR